MDTDQLALASRSEDHVAAFLNAASAAAVLGERERGVKTTPRHLKNAGSGAGMRDLR